MRTDEHATAIFEKHTMIPVLSVAMQRTANERAASVTEILSELKALLLIPSKIAVKIEGRILFVDLAEVIAVEAEGNYVSLKRPSGSYLLRGSISTLAKKLRPCGFIRIHRSVLVNASCVQEIQQWNTREYVLRTTEGKEYTVSRTYKRNLRSMALIWMGNDSLCAGQVRL
jgi:DNA-binding LytR/AlgR family response regulator